MRWLFAMVAFCLPLSIQAAPDLSHPLGPTIADHGSKYYQFNRQLLTSEDGKRHYRITIAVPKKAAPKTGYPVIYMLDGNSALAALSEQRLAALQANPPVIVSIGYQTKLRFDVTARARDYTPPRQDGKPIASRRPSGGADQFYQLISQKIKPRVNKAAHIDLQQQTLWGHSYGGLFTLYVLTRHPNSFQRYAAADPSLWWQHGDMITRFDQLMTQSITTPTQVLVMHGGRLKPHHGGPHASGSLTPSQQARLKQRQQMMADIPAELMLKMTRKISSHPRITAHYREFPALSHGPLFSASIPAALRLAQGHLQD